MLVAIAALLGLIVGPVLGVVAEWACSSPLRVHPAWLSLGTAVLFAATAARLSRLDPMALPAYLYLAAVAVMLTATDLRVRRLPNAIVLPSYPVLAGLLSIAAAWQRDWWPLARAGIGSAALFAFYLGLAWLHPDGMGFGDVKLAGILGGLLAHRSWAGLVFGAFSGFVVGALVGLVLIALRRADRRTTIPYGPSMLAGAFVAILAGP